MRAVVVLALTAGLAGCARAALPPPVSQETTPAIPGQADEDARAVDAVTAVHGGAGPWVVAGYRMGEFALAQLGLTRGTFDLEVTHFSPREVQYSCIADGAAAATGASLGKLNLALAAAAPADTRTTYRRRSTGQEVTLRVTAAFAARFLNVSRSDLAAAGRAVLHLRDQEIFEVVPQPP